MSGLPLTTRSTMASTASLFSAVTLVAAQAVATTAGPSVTDARLTAVSGGDAIIEPFWDPALGAWQKWSQATDAVQAHGEQYWCMVTLDWTAAAPGQGPALRRSYAGEGKIGDSHLQVTDAEYIGDDSRA